MATARAHRKIPSPPDSVWDHITRPTAIVDWFPGVTDCTMNGNVRHVSTSSGIEVDEEIVSNDAELRRFQYRLLPGAVPVTSHLATVDVIGDGTGSLVVYGVDVAPDAFGESMQTTIEAALDGLQQLVARTQV